ncbi:MAG: hypothetical protein ACO1G9_13605 [Bacteroidota bacterium]
MKDVGLNTILNWENEAFDNDDFTEALAGVIILLLGRTVVIVADTFITATQEQIKNSCDDVATQIRDYADNPGGNHSGIENLIPHIDPNLIKLAADCVEIGGVVLGPLTGDTRRRVRNLLYQVFEPIPPGRGHDFLTSLGDDFFIPNIDQLNRVTYELATISKDRFILFVEQFILKVGEYILKLLEDLILAIIDLVVNWEQHLGEVLQAIADALRNLEATMRQINQRLIDCMSTATEALHLLFQTFGDSNLKNRIKSGIKDKFVDKALDALEDNNIYKVLPSDWKRDIRNLADGAVDDFIDNPFTQPIFNAVAAIANQLDALLPNVRELDPDDNLPEQLMLLILDKIEENINSHFGDGKPHISPEIDFRYYTWVYDPPFSGHWQTHHIRIPLGRIEINIIPVMNIVRDAIHALDFYHSALNDACFKLGIALAEEAELLAAQLLHNDKKDDKARVDKINNEHNNEHKEISILSPVNHSHFTNSFDVRIHLGGVGMTYLGLGKDEMQRVLIYINGELIPPKSLIIDDSGLPAEDNALHLKDFDFVNLNSFDKKTGNFVNAFNSTTGIIKSGKASIMTDTAVHYPSQNAAGKAADKGTQFAFSHSKLQELPESKAVYKSAKVNAEAGGLYFEKSTKTIVKEKGHVKGNLLVHTYELKNNLPGRGISPSKVDNLLKNRTPGLLIQFKVELDKPFVVEGVNVLTVVVVERGGNRHQQNVSFTVSHEPATSKPVPGVLHILDPVTGKTAVATMTINNIKNHLVNIDRQKGPKLEDYLATVKKGKVKKANPAKEELISIEKHVIIPMKKKETIVVIQKDKNGKETPIDKEIIITYSSVVERKIKLIELKLDNKTLAKKNQRLKTENVSYEKALPVFGDDKKAIDSVTQVSTFVKKETLDVLNDDGKKVDSLSIEYSSVEEREKKLGDLKKDKKLLRSKSVETEEKIVIADKDGKLLKTFNRSSQPPEFKDDKIRTYKPNILNEVKLNKDINDNFGINVKNEIIVHPQKDNGSKEYKVKTNALLEDKSAELKKRIATVARYLEKQNTINFSKK